MLIAAVTTTIISMVEYVLVIFVRGGKVIVKYETLRLIRWQRSLKETWSDHFGFHIFFFSFLDYSRVYVWEAKKWCFLTTWSMDKTIHNFHAFCALYKLRGGWTRERHAFYMILHWVVGPKNSYTIPKRGHLSNISSKADPTLALAICSLCTQKWLHFEKKNLLWPAIFSCMFLLFFPSFQK